MATPCWPAPVSAMTLGFPILFGEQSLAHRVVDLVGTRVRQVFPLEPQIESELLRETFCVEDGRWSTDIRGEQLSELGTERSIVPRGRELALELLESRHERLGCVLTPVGAKSSSLVWPGHWRFASSRKAATLAGSLMPGDDSRPDEASTPHGSTVSMAVDRLSGVSPPASTKRRSGGTSRFQSSGRPVPPWSSPVAESSSGICPSGTPPCVPRAVGVPPDRPENNQAGFLRPSGRLIGVSTVRLHAVGSGCRDRFLQFPCRAIDGDQDPQHWNPIHERSSLCAADCTRRSGSKHETNGVGAAVNCVGDIRLARQPTDLDPRHDAPTSFDNHDAGSSATTRASPTRIASYPAFRMRSASSVVWMPLSATVTTPSTLHHRGERLRNTKVRDEGLQVSVVDADQGRPGCAGDRRLFPVMNLNKGIDARLRSCRDHAFEQIGTEGRNDEQHRIGPRCPRFEDLGGIQDEVLAQHRNPNAAPNCDEVIEGSVEVRRFGEDADRRGAGVLVDAGLRGSVEAGGQDSPRR